MINKEQDTQPIILDGRSHFTHNKVHDYIRQLELEVEILKMITGAHMSDVFLHTHYEQHGLGDEFKRIERTFHT